MMSQQPNPEIEPPDAVWILVMMPISFANRTDGQPPQISAVN